MPKRDPFTLQKKIARLDSLSQVFRQNQKKPFIGVTCGGSSRKAKGANVAATTATLKQPGDHRG